MIDDHWAILIIVTFLVPLIIALSCVLILRFTLDKRVRDFLPKDKIYGSVWDAYFGVGRTIVFGYACAWPKVNNSKNIRPYYNDLDIKRFANRFEIVVGYVLSYSVALLICSLVVFGLLDLFGVVDLE